MWRGGGCQIERSVEFTQEPCYGARYYAVAVGTAVVATDFIRRNLCWTLAVVPANPL